jgi:hypothetical protein
MDIRSEAQRLTGIGTAFVYVGWFFVIYALVAGLFWWIDLTSRPNFNFLQALGLSLNAIAGPLFLALLVAGLGHFLRLFALYTVSGREAIAGRETAGGEVVA